jgi:hypothetical protein
MLAVFNRTALIPHLEKAHQEDEEEKQSRKESKHPETTQTQ